MNLRLAAWIGAVVLAGGLGACAGDVGYYGPEPAYADVDYDGFYDGFYGPFNGGYWGPNGFYHWNPGHQHYHFDNGAHFRRQAAPGFSAIHGHAPAARGARGGGGGRR
jgi:hypothetical protein